MTEEPMTKEQGELSPENRALVYAEPNVIHYDTMTAGGRVDFCEMTKAALNRLLDAARAEGRATIEAVPSLVLVGGEEGGSSSASLPAHPAIAAATVKPCDLEEAIRLAEVGEYLFDAKSFVAGDGYHEPRELSINWEWQQSAPNTYGEGALLAEATAWHESLREDGIETQAARLRRLLTRPAEHSAGVAAPSGGCAGKEALEESPPPSSNTGGTQP
jgi:hypothetical protein